MNLYRATVERMYLRDKGPGMMAMDVVIHAPNPQSAGKKLKTLWPEWVQRDKFQIVRGSFAASIGTHLYE
jgi:hypothetical protein